MPAITQQNAPLAFVKLVAAQFLPALVSNLVMARLVNRDYEATLASAGDTVNVPIPPVMASNNIAETGSVQTQNPNAGNAQIVLTTHQESTFQVPDITRILATPNLLALYMEPAVISMAEAIETAILNTYTQVNNSVGSSSAAISESVIESAETTLFKNKVPVNQPKSLVVTPDQYSTLRQVGRFSEDRMIGQGGQVIMEGTLLKVKDFLVFRSQLAPIVSNVHQGLAFVRDAIALTMRKLPPIGAGLGAIAEFIEFGGYGFRVVMSYNPNVLAQQITVDALFGTGTLRPEWACQTISNG